MSTPAIRAFTKLELLAVLVTLILLTIIGLAMWSDNGRARAQRIHCVSNLKQIALGFRLWANDHMEKFPWQVSTNQAGTLEYADSVQVWRHFQAASNELNSPRILACGADTSRSPTAQWSALSNSNISYFLSMNADGSRPGRILAGDQCRHA